MRASGGRKFCRTCISCVSGGRGVRGSAFSVAWPAEEFPRCFKHILLFCSDGGLKILRAPETHLVEESMGVGGLHVHGGMSPPCDELSSWRSMNSRTDSSARHVRVKVAGQTRPYSCCMCPKQARQAQADTCTEMLPCRKFALVPVHVEWGGSSMNSRTDSSARHVRVKVAGQTRPYSCCVWPKQARQAQADTCTEMLPCRKFARVPVHVEWGESSMNSRTDSSARHVRVKVAGQTRPYSCCVWPKQARQAQADTCTEMLPCRKFARVPVHVEWGESIRRKKVLSHLHILR